jgi:hypothetical protein
MADDALIVPDEHAIKALTGEAWMRAATLARAEALVPGAQARAPKDTGAGAASIHAEPVLDDGEWTARVSWTRERFYLRFHELGTVTLPAHPFLAPEGVGE